MGQNDPIFKELQTRYKKDTEYYRRYGNNYIHIRKQIEDTLRRIFIERGGKPIRKYPFYFVLGQSIWFKNLIKDQLEIKIQLCDLNPATTSFTFPDSYVALSRNKKPFHGKVFLLDELKKVFEKYVWYAS